MMAFRSRFFERTGDLIIRFSEATMMPELTPEKPKNGRRAAAIRMNSA